MEKEPHEIEPEQTQIETSPRRVMVRFAIECSRARRLALPDLWFLQRTYKSTTSNPIANLAMMSSTI
jgi:hypothetical protein